MKVGDYNQVGLLRGMYVSIWELEAFPSMLYRALYEVTALTSPPLYP